MDQAELASSLSFLVGLPITLSCGEASERNGPRPATKGVGRQTHDPGELVFDAQPVLPAVVAVNRTAPLDRVQLPPAIRLDALLAADVVLTRRLVETRVCFGCGTGSELLPPRSEQRDKRSAPRSLRASASVDSCFSNAMMTGRCCASWRIAKTGALRPFSASSRLRLAREELTASFCARMARGEQKSDRGLLEGPRSVRSRRTVAPEVIVLRIQGQRGCQRDWRAGERERVIAGTDNLLAPLTGSGWVCGTRYQ